MAIVYAGKFEQTMNALCSARNIAATATRFVALEKQHGPYSFGKFVKYMIPQPEEYANWERDSGGVPEHFHKRLTEVIATNLRSASPLPTVLKVGENVDASHDLDVKVFAHDGHIYLGILMLCPNSELK
jgi:hypothetical protein